MNYKEITTPEIAAERIGGLTEDQKPLWNYAGNDDEMLVMQARLKLSICAKAIKAGKKVDFSNLSKRKWFAVFRHIVNSTLSGSWFSRSTCRYDSTLATVGCRLSFFTEEESDFFCTQFIDLHRIVLNHD